MDTLCHSATRKNKVFEDQMVMQGVPTLITFNLGCFFVEFFEFLKKNLIFDYNSFGNRINFVATFGGAKYVYDNESLMLERSTYVTNCWFSSIESHTIVHPDRSASESSAVTFFSLTRFSPVYFNKEDEIAFIENHQEQIKQ